LEDQALATYNLAAAGAIMLAFASTASAQDLTEAQARSIITPWYSLFNVASRGDVKSTEEQVLTADYDSCSGYLPGECWGRDVSIKVVGNFANSIPDMKFDIKEDGALPYRFSQDAALEILLVTTRDEAMGCS
jgi:hypothetical protein